MQFKDVVGQASVKTKLINTLKTGKISHAQLFLGKEGTGGLPMALAFAQYLNCKNPLEDDSCGVCESCQKMSKLIHPDVHFSYPVVSLQGAKRPSISLDFIGQWREAVSKNPYLSYYEWLQYLEAGNKQGNITISEARDIIKKLSLKAFEGGDKVLIMWLPEYLGKEGNALLKILEEPPDNTFFILVAEDQERILNTILSRTQLVRIPPIKNDAIEQALASNHEYGAEEAAQIARLADGNYHLALSLSGKGEQDYSSKFIEWMRLCFQKSGLELIQWVNQISGTGREEQKNFLTYSLQMLEEIFLLGEGLKEGRKLRQSDYDFAEKFSGYVNEDTFIRIYDAINKAHYYIERNARSKIVFFHLSLRINQFLRKEKVAG